MDEIREITGRITIDTTGVEKAMKTAAAAAENLQAKMKSASGGGLWQDSAGRWRTEAGKFATEADKAAAGVDKIRDAMKKATPVGKDWAKSFKGAGKNISDVGGTVTKTVSGPIALVGAAALASAKAASDLGETQSKVGVIFGDGAAAIEAWSDTATEKVGLSKQAALDGAATFGIFGKQAELSGNDLATFSQNLVSLSGDIASFSNVDPSVAIEAVGAALRGENESIRQFGVLLDENTIKARAVSEGIVKAMQDPIKIQKAQARVATAQEKVRNLDAGADPAKVAVAQAQVAKAQENYNKVMADGKKTAADRQYAAAKLQEAESRYQDVLKAGKATAAERQAAEAELAESQANLGKVMEGTVPDLTAAQKVMATNAEIMVQLGSEGSGAIGDLARTSGSYANQNRKLQNTLSDLNGELGKEFLPMALDLVKALNESLVPALKEGIKFVQGLSPETKKTAATLAVLLAAIGPVIIIVGKIVGAIGSLIGVIGPLVKAFQAVIMVFRLLSLAFLSNPFLLVVAAVVALAYIIYTNWDSIKEYLLAAWEVIKNTASAVWDGIKNLIAGAFEFIKQAFLKYTIYGLIISHWTEILNFFAGIPGKIGEFVSGVIDKITSLGTFLYDAASNAWGSFVQGVLDALSALPGLVGDILNQVPGVSVIADALGFDFGSSSVPAPAPTNAGPTQEITYMDVKAPGLTVPQVQKEAQRRQVLLAPTGG